MTTENVGIALGGGGARGFVHLGVLKALEEEGIKPDIIAGVSAGSIVGSFIAAGLRPDEVMKIMKENKFTDYAKVNIPINGLLNLDSLKENLEEYLPEKNFADLELPFYIAVSNLNSGEIEYISEGALIPIIQASSSIPVLFSPVEIDGKSYADGGLLDNLPFKPLQEECDQIIGVNIMPVQEKEEIDNLIKVAMRTFELSVSGNQSEFEENCDLYIEPEGVEEYDILDPEHADELFEIGYNYIKGLDGLLDLI
jgi:NTE family protein